MNGATKPEELIARLRSGEMVSLASRGEIAVHPVGPAIIRADALMAKRFPEPRWAVPGIFPEGAGLIVGPPKKGKSWLVLATAVATAGGYALGTIKVDAGDALYLALEDTQRRIQERLSLVLGEEAAPTRLHIATEWPPLGEGAVEHLDAWLVAHPDARLVVIDTFARLRRATLPKASQYQADYDAMSALKQVADRHGVALVVVHHTRKADADDPLDTVSGTTGLAGAADTILVLNREIGRADATLYVRGRDVPEADHALSFDPVTCTWTLLGDADAFRTSQERQEIIDALRGADEPLRPKELAEMLGKAPGAVRYLLSVMVKAGQVDGLGGGRYRLPLTPPNTPNADTPDPPSVSIVRGVRGPHDQGVWICEGCKRPRSTDDQPCPACGATAGRWFSPSRHDEIHRVKS